MGKQSNKGNRTKRSCYSSKNKHICKHQNPKKAQPQQQNIIDCHQSSLQNDNLSEKTEVFPSDNQDDIDIDIHRQTYMKEQINEMFFVRLCDTTQYSRQKKKFKGLLQHYSKDTAIRQILENAFYEGVSNLGNLQRINDDQFWIQTLPILINNYLDQQKQKDISSTLPMLQPKLSRTITLTKAQIYIIIINMFFCSLPAQKNLNTNHKGASFANLMTIKSSQSQSLTNVKLEKLKCFINYFKIMSKRPNQEINKESITIQKSYNSNVDPKYFRESSFNLVNVKVQKGFIEDHDGFNIIVDFANKKIGGGVLNRGSVQEQILFCIYPQLLACICLTFELSHQDSLVVYNAERINTYEGYSDTFKFANTFQTQNPPYQSVILAVDAYDFKYNQQDQFKPYFINRQINKFMSGVQATSFEADERMKICTGKWGCGVFQGNVFLKFLIQWVACSVVGKQMLFVVQSNEEVKEIETMVSFLKKLSNTLQIMEILDEYYDLMTSKKRVQPPFHIFLKSYSS